MIEWRTISARIAALVDAGAFFFKANDSDNHNTAGILMENARGTARNIRQFLDLHSGQIQGGLRVCIESFLEDCLRGFADADVSHPFGIASGSSGVTAALTRLASFRAEFEYLIADTDAIARSLVVRAFTHLQRSIVADDLVRERWERAFIAGETACESLGSCHLLAHGIWAFKTSAKGERTDLVLGEALDITDEIRRASQGLILTEWKRVRREGELSQKLREAYEQARRYREGILAGFEVTSTRYLVIVSGDHFDMPSPKHEGEVTYEYRNIAVAPSTPSQRARRV
jgi:hypothetical protein